MRLWFVVLALVFLQTGCSSMKEDSVTYIDYPEVLNDANYYYKHKDFERAESEVQRYLGSNADVYWHDHAYLLLGEIRENSGRNAKAIDAYKKVLTHSKGYHGTAAAKALYRMSWVYERDKKYNDLLITLLDLERALGRGDNFVKLVETPARLANTYYVLDQWDKALAQRNRVTDEVFDQYKGQAKSPEILFQAKLYRSFIGLQPTSQTPVKSQDILTLTQKELLSMAEVSTPGMAERAFNGIENEYERYFSEVKQLDHAKNAVEVAERNKKKVEELAKFLDYIEELRASRRPPELVSNQQMNLAFFRKIQQFEDQARALTRKLDIGVLPAKRDKNAPETFGDAEPKKKTPVKAPAAPPVPKTPKKL